MDTASNKLYAETPPVKLFFNAAIPGVIGMFAMSIYNIIEVVFVGQFIGGDAFAAMNLAMPLVFITFALSDMIGVGSSVPISIAHGKREHDRANNIFSCSVLLIFLTAIITGILMFAFAPSLIHLMGAENEVAKLAVTYLRINAVMNPLTTLVFAMDNYMRICGFIRRSMALNVFMSCLQIGLLVLFVVVLDLGLVGSALAINLGMATCSIIAIIPFTVPNRTMTLKHIIGQGRLSALSEVHCVSPFMLFSRRHFASFSVRMIRQRNLPHFICGNTVGALLSVVLIR